MSPQSTHQYARRRLDLAVRRGLTALRHNSRAQRRLHRLLVDVRKASTLLQPTRCGARELPALQALVRLARHHDEHLRSSATWAGGEDSSYRLLGSLASHVLGFHPTPPVLTSVWLMADNPEAGLYRRWFVEHARGTPFRKVTGLPLAMTRRMEHIFLRSPPHLPLPAALRRAEILGLDGPVALVDALLWTTLGRSLAHGSFWRSALHFFINHWDELGAERVQALVETITMIKFGQPAGGAGVMHRPPAFPDFSLAGRTPRSLDRFVRSWRGPSRRPPPDNGWRPSGLAGLSVDDPSYEGAFVRWQIVELLGPAELRTEGRRLRHCVGSYARACASGRSSIWSLRFARDGESLRSSYTIEVHPRTRRVVQIRGFRNRRLAGRPASIIAVWAQTQQLVLSPGA